MKASDYLRDFERRRKGEGDKEEPTKEHTLQENARERAEERPTHMHAGTAYDWEDVDAYRQELERMEREGPRRHADKVQSEKESDRSSD